MADETVVYATAHVAANATLEQLNAVVCDYETNIGPLV